MGDFAAVDEAMRRHAAIFAAHEFLFSGMSMEGSPELRRFPVYRFRNERTSLGIEIAFFAAAEGLNGGFTVLITKPVNQKLDVEDYLDSRGSAASTERFAYRDPGTDVRGFADDFLRMLGGMLDGELKPILDGEYFEATPMDWMGYK